jgi:hypothetical protein
MMSPVPGLTYRTPSIGIAPEIAGSGGHPNARPHLSNPLVPSGLRPQALAAGAAVAMPPPAAQLPSGGSGLGASSWPRHQAAQPVLAVFSRREAPRPAVTSLDALGWSAPPQQQQHKQQDLQPTSSHLSAPAALLMQQQQQQQLQLPAGAGSDPPRPSSAPAAPHQQPQPQQPRHRVAPSAKKRALAAREAAALMPIRRPAPPGGPSAEPGEGIFDVTRFGRPRVKPLAYWSSARLVVGDKMMGATGIDPGSHHGDLLGLVEEAAPRSTG